MNTPSSDPETLEQSMDAFSQAATAELKGISGRADKLEADLIEIEARAGITDADVESFLAEISQFPDEACFIKGYEELTVEQLRQHAQERTPIGERFILAHKTNQKLQAEHKAKEAAKAPIVRLAGRIKRAIQAELHNRGIYI